MLNWSYSSLPVLRPRRLIRLVRVSSFTRSSIERCQMRRFRLNVDCVHEVYADDRLVSSGPRVRAHPSSFRKSRRER